MDIVPFFGASLISLEIVPGDKRNEIKQMDSGFFDFFFFFAAICVF